MNVDGGNSTKIDAFNERHLYLRIPAITFLAFLLPVGILGNAFTIYIYGFRLKIRVVTFFLVIMAVADLTCCLIGIPMEVYRLRYYYNYPNEVMCKVKAYIISTCNIYSMIMIFILSMERYLSITKCSSYVEFRSARGLGTILLVFSSLMAMPVHAWSRRRSFLLNNGVTVFKCITFLEKELCYYFLGLLGFYVVTSLMMFVVYWFVFLTVNIQQSWNKRMKSEAQTDKEISMCEEIYTILNQQKVINRITIAITVASLITRASYFALIILKRVTHLDAPNQNDYFFFILEETWVLHGTINPIVYGLINSDFRREVLKVTKVFCNKTVDRNLESQIEIKI